MFLIVFVALATVGGMLAQEPAGRFYGPIVSGSWPVRIPLQKSKNFTMPPQPATPCSIPLLGAQIPKDVDPKIKQITPRSEQLAPMPQVKGPAPACESWSSR
jgi:hypothetical protein